MYKTFTFYFSTLVCLAFLLPTYVHAQIWTGNGDGTSWTDGNNWDSMTAPTAGGIVEIQQAVTITGEGVSAISQLVIGDTAEVILDLDLTIMDTFNTLVITPGGSLTLGNGEKERTITLSPSSRRTGIVMTGNNKVSELTINKNMTLNIIDGSIGISNNATNGTVVNNGTILMTENVKTGIRGRKGEIINNGNITCDGLEQGFELSGGDMTNNESITINLYQSLGVEITDGSRLLNNGTISTSAGIDTRTSSYAYAVGQDSIRGVLTNRAQGVIINNGGTTARGIFASPLSLVNNKGTIILEGANRNGTLLVDGTLTNGIAGLIDLGNSSTILSAEGSFFNEGLIKTTRGGFLVNARDSSTFINNGFYLAENINSLANEDETGTIIDNGINLQDASQITIDAGGSCVVDIAEAPHRWLEGDQVIGVADSTGNLTLTENSISSSPVTLTTALEGVAITLTNVCPEAVGATTSFFAPNLDIVKLNIYPTLVNTQKTLSIDLSTLPNDPIEFSIINQLGQIMKVQTINGGITSGLDIHSLPNGHFWIIGQQEDAQLVGKFTVAQF